MIWVYFDGPKGTQLVLRLDAIIGYESMEAEWVKDRPEEEVGIQVKTGTYHFVNHTLVEVVEKIAMAEKKLEEL